jgi:hypothetical protein
MLTVAQLAVEAIPSLIEFRQWEADRLLLGRAEGPGLGTKFGAHLVKLFPAQGRLVQLSSDGLQQLELVADGLHRERQTLLAVSHCRGQKVDIGTLGLLFGQEGVQLLEQSVELQGLELIKLKRFNSEKLLGYLIHGGIERCAQMAVMCQQGIPLGLEGGQVLLHEMLLLGVQLGAQVHSLHVRLLNDGGAVGQRRLQRCIWRWRCCNCCSIGIWSSAGALSAAS